MVSVDSVDSVDTVKQPLTRFMFLMSYRDDDHQQEFDDNSNQVNSVRINETRVESNTNNKSNGDHSDSKICRKDSRTSKDLPPVPPREREPPPREREPPPVPSMESLISRRASSSKNNNEIYSKLRLLPANIFPGSKVNCHLTKSSSGQMEEA